ncbi:hypothetical protein [Kitasatospora sp. MAP5-34]|uniref:hypothetical protein n=1 Tax=Kitasatospora sp. MAP5-34 TaxID=3035102 RepID=UPI0024771D31|nr:hypothetical protein [Kitasatospora sp. MAP5-34]
MGAPAIVSTGTVTNGLFGGAVVAALPHTVLCNATDCMTPCGVTTVSATGGVAILL